MRSRRWEVCYGSILEETSRLLNEKLAELDEDGSGFVTPTRETRSIWAWQKAGYTLWDPM